MHPTTRRDVLLIGFPWKSSVRGGRVSGENGACNIYVLRKKTVLYVLRNSFLKNVRNDCKCGEWSFRGRVVPIRKDAPGRVSSACISAKTTVSAEKGRFVDASATDSQRCSWTCVECMRVWHTQCTKGATQFGCWRGRRMFVFLGGHPLCPHCGAPPARVFAVFPKENARKTN